MKYLWLDEFLLSMKGVNKDFKKEWNWIRYRIEDKMFAAICLDDHDKPYYITLKLEPLEGEFLRNQYEDIIPGYYMNKVNWNSINPDGIVPDDLLKDMLEKSYHLVLSGFSKKKQMQIVGGEKMNKNITCCGTDCLTCSCYGTMCKGCNECEGKVFHALEGKACPIYECSINKNGYKNCSSCKNLPCDIWREAKDPSFSDEEFEKNICERVERLKTHK